ncbi:MAG: amidohydrolase family protein [Stellaceae bacterium]
MRPPGGAGTPTFKRQIPFFGPGRLLWASSYPHPDSVWPNSRAAIERPMQSLTQDMCRKLTHDNAAALYGLG